MKIYRTEEGGGSFVAPLAVNLRMLFIPVKPQARKAKDPELTVGFTFDGRSLPWSFNDGAKGLGTVKVDTNGDLVPDTVLAGNSNFSPARRPEHRNAKWGCHGVSFAVAPGEIFGFLGPNGGGKSTLFRVLATLAAPERGRVHVFGHDVTREARAVRRLSGVAFQHPGLDRELTVAENLLHHGHLYGLSGSPLGRRIDEALGRFGLAERKKQKVKELSGGLARRVEIAKALLPAPRLLLLDEPSTGLDPGARNDLWTLLAELAQGGVTVLLTTHFMEEADRCHRLALLDQGRIVATGAPAALKEEVGGDVVTLTGRDPAALAAELAGSFPDLSPVLRDGAVQFSRERAHEWVARLIEALPGRIEAITVSRPSLEDVFLKRTGHRLTGEPPAGK